MAEAGTGEQKGRIHLLGLDARGSSFNSLSFSLSLFFLSLPLCFPSSRFVDSSLKQRRELDAMPSVWNPLIFFVTSGNVVHLDLVLIEVDVEDFSLPVTHTDS